MLKSDMIFGKPWAWLYSIEWQKHSLPHAHILVWLIPEDKIIPDKIDHIVCAEIPDPALDPELHQIVMSNMVRGPCGSINPCMEHGQCSKRYLIQETKQTVIHYTEEEALKMVGRNELTEVNDDMFNLALNGLQEKVTADSYLSMAYLSHKQLTIIGLQGSTNGK